MFPVRCFGSLGQCVPQLVGCLHRIALLAVPVPVSVPVPALAFLRVPTPQYGFSGCICIEQAVVCLYPSRWCRVQ